MNQPVAIMLVGVEPAVQEVVGELLRPIAANHHGSDPINLPAIATSWREVNRRDVGFCKTL